MTAFVIDDRPAIPAKSDYGIAIVGCGGIVNAAHLPAYRRHGLRIVGCYDRNSAAATATAERFAISRVYASLEELLADPAVEIVDIAIPPHQQRGVAEAAMRMGKHVLLQKPLEAELQDAAAIVAASRITDRKAAVNQQLRWSGGIAAAKQIIEHGAIGQPVDAQLRVSVHTPWADWPWIGQSKQIDLLYHSIHYFDAFRYLFGDPDWITCRLGTFPGQREVGETRSTTIFEFPGGGQGLIAVNHHDHSGAPLAALRILGTSGVIEISLGQLADYSADEGDRLRWRTGDDPAGTWHMVPLTTRRQPDSFIGPMASLMTAIQSDGLPLTDVGDNLVTLRTVHAAYRSAAENRSILLSDVQP